MKKIYEHTDGSHIYMILELDGVQEEIDVYYLPDGTIKHKTTGDNDNAKRESIINAFNNLY